MRIGIFEDQGYRNLQPLTYLRPAFDLRCGMYLLREKIERQLHGNTTDLFVRTSLQNFLTEKHGNKNINDLAADDYLFLNGRGLFETVFLKNLLNMDETTIFVADSGVIAAIIKQPQLTEITTTSDGILDFTAFSKTKTIGEGAVLLNYPWDFIHANPDQISFDYQLSTTKSQSTADPKGVALMFPENMYIADSAQIDPGVVIDATEGPVYIDEEAHIFPQATIIGPAYVGKKSLIKIGAKIYEGTSIGEVCKVGGEVEETIIHSYSNKQHDGFLGHAYLGQWVNLGADTNNSDLKNNYGNVRTYVNAEQVDTGSTFVGLTMADHSKSGINTMFNTGTVVGIMCNVYGADFPPKWIPSFSWGGSGGVIEHNLDKALAVARKVMARRKVNLGEAEEQLIRQVFEETAQFRSNG